MTGRSLRASFALLAAALSLAAPAATARTPDAVMQALGLPGGRAGEAGDIERLQTDLSWLGLLNGQIHGRMDEATCRAAASFQTSLGARPDGFPTEAQRRELRRRAAAVEDAAEFRTETFEWTGMRLDVPQGVFDAPRVTGVDGTDLQFMGRDVARTRMILRLNRGGSSAGAWLRTIEAFFRENAWRVAVSGSLGDIVYAVAIDQRDRDDRRDDRRVYFLYHATASALRGVEIELLESEAVFMRPLVARILRGFAPAPRAGLSAAEIERRLRLGQAPGADGEPDWYRTMVSNGSGSLVSREGHVLTNHHVVSGCRTLSVNGRTATLVATDVRLDLALLLVPALAGREPVRFARRPPNLGETVLVLGYPVFSLSPSLNATSGIISSNVGFSGDRTRYQITAPVQPGNSGGPVISVGGAQVAVVASKASTTIQVANNIENIGWVIRGAIAERFLRRFGVEPVMLEDAYAMPDEGLAESLRSWRRFVVRVECRA